MKIGKKWFVLAVMGMLFLTACGNQNSAVSNTPSSSSSSSELSEETETQTLEEETEELSTDMENDGVEEETESQPEYEKYENIPIVETVDFSDVVNFIENDPAFDSEKVAYRIYLQNVMLQNPEGDKRTEIIVCAETMKRSNGKHKTSTLGAEEKFLDSLRDDFPYFDEKAEWCDGEHRYPANLVIDACMNEYHEIYGYEDLQLYRKYDLISTFRESDWVLYEEYDNSQSTE